MKIKKLAERIKYWSQALLLPVYGFSFLIPRNNKIWLFGCSFGKRFADNPRYLYLYCSQMKTKEVRSIWITRKKEIAEFLNKNGYEAYYCYSIKGVLLSLRAGVYIYDNYTKDINFWLSGGAVKFNLWHGSGNKKTNFDNVFDKERHPKTRMDRFKTFLRRISDEKPEHFTLATSEAMAQIFTSAFQTDENHIIIEGYPRNDALFEEYEICNLLTDKESELLDKIVKLKQENTIILAYVPTFRDSELEFFKVMDLEKFNEYLKKYNRILITKLHPKSKLKKQFEKICYTNIINADADIDIYTFLSKVDLLITDYSSVYTDYMLLNRPVVAFHYDWELYTTNTRDSYINHDIYMPECKAVNMPQLMDVINEVLEHDECLEKRLISKARMFKSYNGESAKGLFEKIFNIAQRRG